ncbi:MAG TPA: heme uptake protein IsdC [Lysinibacillus sp.]|uniref:Heme uptake protein IsdC n=1 Tax=Lysinibacillus fusiformis TaxID=28031 RepID=A0A2I0V3V0_9BACI|nr:MULTISPECIES: heme uptake protein IsdC [Lysinibacillus]PKU52987.1 heme uptake protein IsdC [Lysinibacillus fusiformis]HBT71335.1 heme uptake protein IsdC [Lysinibacillus sp.]
MHSVDNDYQLKGGFTIKRLISVMLVAFLTIFVTPNLNASAALADGKYTINYQVNKPDSSSASMANDYFLKPATIIVQNGTSVVQMKMKKSAWITKFESSTGGNKVVSENKAEDTRIVQFALPAYTSKTAVTMKVDIDDLNYHHEYTVDFVWDAASLKNEDGSAVAATTVQNNSNTTKKTDNTGKTDISSVKEKEVNPQTSDAFPIGILLLFCVSGFILFNFKKRMKEEIH